MPDIFFEEALTIRRHENDRGAISNTLRVLRQLARSEGKLERAGYLIRKALANFSDLNSHWVVTIFINDFVLISMEKGEFSRAAIMAGANASLRKRHQIPIPTRELESYGERMGSIKSSLEIMRFEECWRQGSEMIIQKAIEFIGLS